jgi:hypothetical protein
MNTIQEMTFDEIDQVDGGKLSWDEALEFGAACLKFIGDCID